MALIDRPRRATTSPDELISAAQFLAASVAVGDCTRDHARTAVADLAHGDARVLHHAARHAIADGRLAEGWLLAESGSLVQARGETRP